MVPSDGNGNPETIFTNKPTQWDTEVRPVENPGFENVVPLKHRVGLNTAMQRLLLPPPENF